MKKLIALVVVGLLVATSAFALELQAGVKTDFTLNKEMRTDKTNVVVDYSAQNYDLYTDIKIGDSLVISPKAGLSSNSIDIDEINTTLDGGIGWNIGVDGELAILKSQYVDLDGIASYRFSRVDVDNIQYSVLDISNPIETITTLHEWEIGAKVSKNLAELFPTAKMNSITPYVGMVYSDARGETEANLAVLTLSEQMKAEHNFGIRTGISIEPVKDLKAAIDVKFVDESAISGSISYLF